MQNVVLAGNIDPNDVDITRYRIRKFPRPGYTLFLVSQCNEGKRIDDSIENIICRSCREYRPLRQNHDREPGNTCQNETGRI
jgi:hypothetical protein